MERVSERSGSGATIGNGFRTAFRECECWKCALHSKSSLEGARATGSSSCSQNFRTRRQRFSSIRHWKVCTVRPDDPPFDSFGQDPVKNDLLNDWFVDTPLSQSASDYYCIGICPEENVDGILRVISRIGDPVLLYAPKR